MFCVNNEVGCPWQGDPRNHKEHLEHCGYNHVDCPMDCRTKVLQKDVQAHLKRCSKKNKSCSFCKKNIREKSLKEHQTNCPQFPVECPENCDAGFMERSHIQNHLNQECPKTKKECPFSDLGCYNKTHEIHMLQHMDSDKTKHMNLLVIEVSSQKKVCEDLEQKIQNCKSTIDTLNAQNLEKDDQIKLLTDKNETQKNELNQLTITVKEQEKLIAEHKAEGDKIISDVEENKTETKNLKEEVKTSLEAIQQEKTKLENHTKQLQQQTDKLEKEQTDIVKNIKDIKDGQEKFKKIYETNIKNTEDKYLKLKTFAERLEEDVKQGKEEAEAHQQKINELEEKQILFEQESEAFQKRLNNYEISFDELNISHEMLELSNEQNQQRIELIELPCETYTWQLTGIGTVLKKLLSDQLPILSMPFYSFRRGHKLRAFLQVSMDNPGYLCVGFHVIPGEFDDLLKWPFLHPVTFTLLDQTSLRGKEKDTSTRIIPRHSSQYVKRQTHEHQDGGFAHKMFIHVNELANGRYIHNDSILVKITVQDENHSIYKQ